LFICCLTVFIRLLDTGASSGCGTFIHLGVLFNNAIIFFADAHFALFS